MQKKYYKVGDRPVYLDITNDEPFVFVFNWANGKFEEDFTYYKKIKFALFMDETEELQENEFLAYVERLKNK